VTRAAVPSPPPAPRERLVLASASPRRKALLSLFTTDFAVIPSRIDEIADGPVEEQVVALARAKARDVAARESGLVLAADTVVALDGGVLGKPRDAKEARAMLERLSGRDHRVLTGLCLLSTRTGECREAWEGTTVSFRTLADPEIAAYLATGEYRGKAGGYAIQGWASAFVTGIRGDFFNVMGLPLCRTVLLLREMGYELLAAGAR
jgi:septum formation protein